MNDEAWLLDVVKRCGVHEARASALARAGAQMLRRLAIKCPPGVFGKGECCGPQWCSSLLLEKRAAPT